MSNKYIFLLLTGLMLLFSTAHNLMLDIEALYFDILSNKLAYEQIQQIISSQKKWYWLSYALLALLLFLKITVIAAIIDLGCFIFNQKLKFKQLFNIVVKAEFIFLLVIIFKTGWFYFFQTDYTLEDLQYFYPLSAINIVGYQGIDPWWIYPLQVLNLFELAYWFILSYLLGKALNSTMDKGISIVASSYGVALLIWVVGVMFFTLNMS